MLYVEGSATPAVAAGARVPLLALLLGAYVLWLLCNAFAAQWPVLRRLLRRQLGLNL